MNENRIEEYLDRWEDLQQQGREVSAEELCPQEPAIWDELRRRIEALKRTNWLVQSSEEPNDDASLGCTPANFDLPDVLGRYELKELIGSGGFGQVWQAYDPDLHRQVAIKIPRPDRLTTTEQTERFLTEARHIAQLRHPGIVTIYDVGQADGLCYIVTDLVTTGNLAEQVEFDRVEPQQAACIVEQVCQALELADREGIVHCDIKPSNILIDADGRVLLADFGIATTVDELQTKSAAAVGTLAYMSPEQLRGVGIDARSDIYSLGVVFYELLTGRLPFHADNFVELRKRIEDGISQNIFEHTDKVPPGLQSICLKALATNPNDRFSSAKEMASTLRLALEEHTSHSGKSWGLSALGLVVIVGLILWSSNWWGKTIEPDSQLRAKLLSPTEEQSENLAIPSVVTTIVPILENISRFTGHPGAVHAVAISQDGLQLASGGEDKMVHLWQHDDADTEPVVMQQYANVTALTFSPDGQFLSCGCSNGLIRRWRITGEQPKEIVVYPGQGAVRVMESSSDKQFLAAGDETGITRLWKLGPQPATLATFPKANGPVLEVAFPSTGNQIIIGIGSQDGQPGELWFWGFDPSGQRSEIHPLDTQSLIGTSNIKKIVISLDGHTIVAGDTSGSIFVWQAESSFIENNHFNFRFIGTFNPHTAPLTSLCLSENGEWCFSTAEDGTGVLWSIPDLQKKAQTPVDVPTVRSAIRSADGQQLITGHVDGSIRIWKVPL